ncbi:hypothetical protein DYQ86_12650 [Acidobacteria bacterium AB60]|nr:hypothetical protein DYQ86_12650 [Acidobacteria bacterium AB60]
MRILGGLVWVALSLMGVGRVDAAEPEVKRVSVAQLLQTLRGAAAGSDADLAQQLVGLELTERMTHSQESEALATAPGEKARTALRLIADRAAFLDPESEAVAGDPTPDAAATRAMLVKVVNYVNTTNRQLPNLMAERTTTSFEDRPQEDALGATGVVSYSYLPLHWTGGSTVTVTYRDRREVVDEKAGKEKREGAGIGGLVTSGEFGPILSTVVGDALQGKITWARWEKDGGTVAVFHYQVPVEKSKYRVQFCCVVGGYNGDGTPQLEKFDERAAYHGEIAFDPSNGAVLRVTATAEMAAGGLVPHAWFAITYGPVMIGGRSYICPLHGVAKLQAHTTGQKAAFSRANYQGAAKNYLNDVVFSNYRRFGSEMRMVPAAVQ